MHRSHKINWLPKRANALRQLATDGTGADHPNALLAVPSERTPFIGEITASFQSCRSARRPRSCADSRLRKGESTIAGRPFDLMVGTGKRPLRCRRPLQLRIAMNRIVVADPRPQFSHARHRCAKSYFPRGMQAELFGIPQIGPARVARMMPFEGTQRHSSSRTQQMFSIKATLATQTRNDSRDNPPSQPQ